MTYEQPALPFEHRCESCSRHAEVEVTFRYEHATFTLCSRYADDAVANTFPSIAHIEAL